LASRPKSYLIILCLCMVERKEILYRMKPGQHSIVNDNSNIFARFIWKCRFHTFSRTDSTALRTSVKQIQVPSTRHFKLTRVCHIVFSLTTRQPVAQNYTHLWELCTPLRMPSFFFGQLFWTSAMKPKLLSQFLSLTLPRFKPSQI
jgi:hypothetical protein